MKAPEKIGKYWVTGVIGEGESGVVYKAFDPLLRRVMAVKSLHPNLLGDARVFATRLSEQAQAIARVNHPGIVNIHQIDEADGRAFIAMEHVAGPNLAQWLAATPLPPQAALLQVMDQMLEALECAHHAGVRHGDLKPSNVLVTGAGLVKLTDFGLARAEGRAGTLPGSAPEYQSGRLVDHRADIYAAGAILYRMLVGHDPYSDSLHDTAADALAGALRPPSTVAEAQRPPLFDAVVARALRHDPSQRFNSATEFRDALRDATTVRMPMHGARTVTLDAGATGHAASAVVAPMRGELADAVGGRRPSAVVGQPVPGVPPLTIAIPDSVLSMPSHDPWAHGGRPVQRPEPGPVPDLVVNDEGHAAALQSQVERTRRASVASAAAAANAALDAANSAAARAVPVPYVRSVRPKGALLEEPLSFSNAAPVDERGGIVVSQPVSQPMAMRDRDRALPDGLADLDPPDLTLPLAGDDIGIPAEALRRVMKVLSAHFGEMASDVLTLCAPRAGTIPELHALLVAQAGGGIDKKRLAKQLRAVAKLPL